MPPLQSLDPSVIDRYLAGEASPSEKAVIDARRQADPAWAARIDALAAEFARTPARDWNVDAAWSTFQRRLPASRFPASGSVGRVSALARAPRLTPWLAAAGVAFAAAGFGAWRYLAHQRGAAAGETRFAHEIVTPNGSRHTVTLSDGSRVTLNAGSRLRWGRDFGSGARDVYLDGEAYFAVTHDERRPFRVHARNAIAQDVGTRFTVRAYPELAHLEVAVAEGAVSLRRDRPDTRDSAVVSAGQLGRVDDSGALRVESNVAVDRWTAWTTGSLVLEGLTLKDAVPQLERWYDATITVTDARLAERQVTARFHEETLPQALDALSLALGARWERQGRAVTITPARP